MKFDDIKIGSEYRVETGFTRGRGKVIAKGKYRQFNSHYGSVKVPVNAVGTYGKYVPDEKFGDKMLVLELEKEHWTKAKNGTTEIAVVRPAAVKKAWEEHAEEKQLEDELEAIRKVEVEAFNLALKKRADAINSVLIDKGLSHLARNPEPRYNHPDALEWELSSDDMSKLIKQLAGIDLGFSALPSV
jgi:hypothetical protein